jgi:predicted phage baseplate assembly protein
VGNVGARTLTVLKSSIPYVAEVVNLQPAIGGTDPEDIEHAKWRAPQLIRGRERAVTADDFEVLAREASPAVGRARCVVVGDPLTNGQRPGTVRLLLVPALSPTDGPIDDEQLQLSERARQDVQAYLDERRLLTTEIVLESPAYVRVTVTGRIRPRRRANRARVVEEATRALYRYLHPTTGGPEGSGWPFGRELFIAEVYSLLQGLEDVDAVEDVQLYTIDAAGGLTGPAQHVVLEPDAVLCSHQHRLEAE